MTISIVDIAGANFRTDEASDELNSEFMKRLGMRKRYLPARLALSRSLGVPSRPESISSDSDWGKTIKGDTFFGTGADLMTWVSLIVQHGPDQEYDVRGLVGAVAAHWRRGINLLDADWRQSGEDISRFVRKLVEHAELPLAGRMKHRERTQNVDPFSSNELISVPVGEISTDANSGAAIEWVLNGPGCSPHSAVMGGVGSGKTRTAVSILRAVRKAAPIPIIAFDFKGDLATDESGGGYHLEQLYDATVIEPPRMPVPLNVLALRSRDDIDLSQAASRFRESFSRLKGARLGDKQRDAVYEAASRALRSQTPCQLDDFQRELISIYAEREMKEDGAIAAAREICRFPLFTPELTPDEFFSRSWIIKLPPHVVEESRSIVVNLVLDALDQYLNSLPDTAVAEDGSRGMRIIAMIDEAHRVLGSRLPSLSNLVRMSRSKGGAVMLISQSPDDFSGEDDDFLSEMGLVAAFSTNAPSKAATRVLGRGANLATLSTGQAYVKRRGDQAARKAQSWSPT
ncbi:DndE family protein [Paracoccus ravus]|uniref:DndE family protein n=1 Tax=Paracoccus ravus TaxID=2447760 RepID=UPI00106ED7F2|nr:DndE family protein [Paracoccus ravus]